MKEIDNMMNYQDYSQGHGTLFASFIGALSIFVFVLVGCGKGKDSGSSDIFPDSPTVPDVVDTPADPAAPVDPNNPGPLDPLPVDAQAFKVTVLSVENYPHYLHDSVDTDPECSILASATTNEDKVCLLEANEGDLWMQGLTWRFNIPPQMCNYVTFDNYYYYNYRSGRGPSSITVNITKNAAGVITGYDCDISSSGGAPANDADCDTLEITAKLSDPTEINCDYNHSLADPTQPNCCFGNYDFKVITTDPTDTVTTIDEQRQWGGAYDQCLSGPAMVDSTWPKDDEGFPNRLYYTTFSNGLSLDYQVTAPITALNNAGNFSIANYYDPAMHAYTGAISGVNTTQPYAINPGEDLSGEVFGVGLPTGTGLGVGNDSYKLTCYNQDFEIIHRIQLQVREWNTYAEYLVYQTSPVLGNLKPDITGTEGVNCEFSSFGGNPCNDISDWDDYPSPANFFPQEK